LNRPRTRRGLHEPDKALVLTWRFQPDRQGVTVGAPSSFFAKLGVAAEPQLVFLRAGVPEREPLLEVP
jgi:hypothetical protein